MKKRIFNIVRYVITIPLIFMLMWGTEIFVRDIPSIGNLSVNYFIESLFFVIASILLVTIAYKLPPNYKNVFVAIASTAWVMHLYDFHIEYIIGQKHSGSVMKYILALITIIVVNTILIIRHNGKIKKESK